MENPYWHDEFKPHLTDRGEIRLLCFEISNLVMASMARQGTGEDPDDEGVDDLSLLDELCFRLAEAELSKRLLRLALLVRTFDDTMNRSDRAIEYANYRENVEKDAGFGAVYKGKVNAVETIRECSNKIIHAEDVRPIYDSDDDRNDPKAMWGMEGTIELEGVQGVDLWQIGIYVMPFLERVLELIQFGEKDVPA